MSEGEMVDRVCRAIREEAARSSGGDMGMRMARAAIEAMREPTDAMLDAGGITEAEWEMIINEAMR